MSIVAYSLPTNTAEQKAAYTAFKALFTPTATYNEASLDMDIISSNSRSPDASLFKIAITTSPALKAVSVQVYNPNYADGFDFGKAFLNDTQEPNCKLSSTQAAGRLSGHVTHLDHTGICVPSEIKPRDWIATVQKLHDRINGDAALYEYPEGFHGYNKDTNLWYFFIGHPRYTNSPDMPAAKFELVHDGQSLMSLVQFDVQVNLSKEKVQEKFPEGFFIDGLENEFLSVIVSTPWDNMRRMRLDIRFADEPDWSNGKFFETKASEVPRNGIRHPYGFATPSNKFSL
jgi:hypothetical protein